MKPNLSTPTPPGTDASSLRVRATSLIYGPQAAADANAVVSRAMAALRELSASPDTGALALAFLHELQVHQVELAMQEEDLRHEQAEFESSLRRQARFFEFAPVACFVIDGDAMLCDMNRAGAYLLDLQPGAALGCHFGSFFAPASQGTWQQMLTDAKAGRHTGAKVLQLLRQGAPRRVLAAVDADPAGSELLIALTDLGE